MGRKVGYDELWARPVEFLRSALCRAHQHGAVTHLATGIAHRTAGRRLFVLMAFRVPNGFGCMNGGAPVGQRAESHCRQHKKHMDFCEMPHLNSEMREREESHASQRF